MDSRIIVRSQNKKTEGLALKRSQTGPYQSRDYMKMVSVDMESKSALAGNRTRVSSVAGIRRTT